MRLVDDGLLRTMAYVDGTWIPADDGVEFGVIDPGSRTQIARVPRLTAVEARRAIEAASKALSAWRGSSASRRAAILRRWAELIREHADDLGRILSAEQGKPLGEAQGEVRYGAAYVEWFAEEAKRVYGDTIPNPDPDRRSVVIKQPVGVCVGITPWNFPSSMITRKVGPALAAGCTIVLKPAEQTPLSALALCELAERAGIPEGVLNVVTTDAAGADAVGRELTENPAVRKLSFTGSTEVGKLLMQRCAKTVKRVSLELGGSAPFIVFDDADIDEAVGGLVSCKYRNAGQTCVSANRIVVQDGVYDAFAERLTEAVRTLVPGPSGDDSSQLGPLIDDQALDKVRRHVDDALVKGAHLATGGGETPHGGTFFEPTVLTDVTREMLLMREETFGPVAGLMRFSQEAEALEIANDTEYGLAAYFYSRDVGRVWRMFEGLEFGMVTANSGVMANEAAPFGGIKESGIGREGSKYGLEEWLEVKHLTLGGLDR